MLQLSVIIIGKNEERHIKPCIQAAIKAASKFKRYEILYVDSASTDRTVEIATSFPITVLGLRPDWEHSPAGGRHIGYLNASGDYLVFVDGDTLLYHDWIEKGIAYLKDNPKVGGVAGFVHEFLEDKSGNRIRFIKNRYEQSESEHETCTFGGICIFPKAILDQVGGFNPFVWADEERELALRIRRAGYTLMRLPIRMSITYGPERDTITEILRRGSTRLGFFGIPIKYAHEYGGALQYIRERLGFAVTFLFSLVFMLILFLIALITGYITLFGLMLLIGFALIVIARKGNIKSVVNSILRRAFLTYWTIRSYLQTEVHEVDGYPTDVIVHKKAG